MHVAGRGGAGGDRGRKSRHQMKRFGLAGFLIFAFVATANAQLKAGDLYQLCTSNIELAHQGCAMWITGFVSGISVTRQAPKTITPVCPPKEATLVIEHFLRGNHDLNDLPAEAVAYGALGLAYPCPPTENPN
jgi:hypothetical protein